MPIAPSYTPDGFVIQSRRYGGTLVGLAPQTKLQAPQTEIWNSVC